mgnify:CR=1 FL=1
MVDWAGLLGAHTALADLLTLPYDVAATTVWCAVECLRKAGAPPGGEGPGELTAPEKWDVLRDHVRRRADPAKYPKPPAGWVGWSGTLTAPVGTTTGRIMMVVSSLNATLYVDSFEFTLPVVDPGAGPMDRTWELEWTVDHDTSGQMPHELALENIDIGGPTMVRGAAKNYPWVTVVVDPSDYDRIIEELTDEGVKPETRRELACKAFAHTARYDAMISDYLSAPSGPTSQTPARFDVTLEKLADLRYGENPHQHAAVYRRDEALSLGGLVQLHGKDLSYNNVVDLDAACGLVAEFDAPAAAVIKHTNPAGCATATDVDAAFHAALACDPTSAFGGIIVVNRALTEAVARTISESFFEIVAAPSFAPEAVSLLSKKRNLRLLTLPNTLDNGGWQFRQTALGWLVQEADTSRALDRESVVVPTKRAPTDAELRDLFFAWRVCKHVKSNAIVIAASEATLGIGAGQMSRIDSVETATRKAGTSTRGAVMASDAFFPFRDGPDAAAAAGITAIIQPGGSVRDEEVIAAAKAAFPAWSRSGPLERHSALRKAADEITAAHSANTVDSRQPRLDFPPYRSSLLRHPTKALHHADPAEVELVAPVFGHSDVDPLEADLTIPAKSNGQEILKHARPLKTRNIDGT